MSSTSTSRLLPVHGEGPIGAQIRKAFLKPPTIFMLGMGAAWGIVCLYLLVRG